MHSECVDKGLFFIRHYGPYTFAEGWYKLAANTEELIVACLKLSFVYKQANWYNWSLFDGSVSEYQVRYIEIHQVEKWCCMRATGGKENQPTVIDPTV